MIIQIKDFFVCVRGGEGARRGGKGKGTWQGKKRGGRGSQSNNSHKRHIV